MTAQYLQINKENIYVESFGSGTPLILLHGGWGTGQAQWMDHIAIYKTHYHVILPDLRGHGRSTNNTGELSIRQFAEDMIELIHVMNLENTVISGWSLGGAIVAYLSIKHPEIAKCFIIGGTRCSPPPPGTEELRNRGISPTGEIDLKKFFEYMSPSMLDLIKPLHNQYPNQLNDLAIQYAAHVYQNLPQYISEELESTNSSILLLIGDRDEIPLEDILKEYNSLRNAELAILPGADHSMCRKRATEYANIVMSYIGRKLTLE